MLKYNLNSTIPGITVRLTPNPLKCETILTESAKREIILLLTIESITDSINSVVYDLEYSSEEKALETFRYELTPWIADTEELRFEQCKKIIGEERINSLNESHCGDCVSNASSCPRCYIDNIIGVNTFHLAHLSHINFGMFT